MAKFKTRARTVDMLGRQQIANASTAISELFKNAYDAYATHVAMDFVCRDDLIAIRDDGIGMTPKEFEENWLVLGTESKYATDLKSKPKYKPQNLPERTLMGEKGIGRLAIALLGRQVLVLTRANRKDCNSDLSMCFVHWGLFELPGINLDDIEIPTKLIRSGDYPTDGEVDELICQMTAYVDKLADKHQNLELKEIQSELKGVKFCPEQFNNSYVGPTLKDFKSGTHFYVFSPNRELQQEIEEEGSQEKRNFSRLLLGFNNSVFCGKNNSEMKTEFKYWPVDGDERDLLADDQFFTLIELNVADHRIKGRIDEFGQFLGNVKVYDTEYCDHVISWPNGNGQPTSCGPFEIEFGYISGKKSETTLPPDEWATLRSKLEKIGGLYVYKDGIRILPYGNADYDWLQIEERKSKKFSYYFFSYRQIFGAVVLTSDQNSTLSEKAGREGFQNNKAYRQLKSILINLFTQLAADFFRKGGEYSDFFDEKRFHLDELATARKEREKLASGKRKKVEVSLEDFFERINSNRLESELDGLKLELQMSMKKVASIKEPKGATKALVDADGEFHTRLGQIKEDYQIEKPRGIGLSQKVLREWRLYKSEFERIDKECFEPFSVEIKKSIISFAKENNIGLSEEHGLNRLKMCEENQKALLKKEIQKTRNSVDEVGKFVDKIAENSIVQLWGTGVTIDETYRGLVLDGKEINEREQSMVQWEKQINELGVALKEKISDVRELLDKIAQSGNENLTLMDTKAVEAMDQELIDLRESADADADLVLLGMSIAVVNHEFETTIRRVRHSLNKLKKAVAEDSKLLDLHEQITASYEHLEENIKLIVPLQRRAYRKKINISGKEINHYVDQVFRPRLLKNNIDLVASRRFLDTNIVSFPSTIYPAFINLVDNAIFWLNSIQGKREIKFDAADTSYLISNNGPAIEKRDYENVFERGFSRKPSGSGLGLYISKLALEKEGMNISVVENPENTGTTFEINWESKND